MYPYVTLKIQNHIPHIYFYPEENMSRKLTQKDENISTEIINLANRLELIEAENDDRLEKLIQLASESDNQLFEDMPAINVENLEFNISQTLEQTYNNYIDSAQDEYKDVEMSEQVRKELQKNRNADILASTIDQIYDILIAKTLLAAYELEITNIHLQSEYNYARLIEKMGAELQKLGLEFTIE